MHVCMYVYIHVCIYIYIYDMSRIRRGMVGKSSRRQRVSDNYHNNT